MNRNATRTKPKDKEINLQPRKRRPQQCEMSAPAKHILQKCKPFTHLQNRNIPMSPTKATPTSRNSRKNPYPTPISTTKKAHCLGRPAKALGFLSSTRYPGLGVTAARARCEEDFSTYLFKRSVNVRPEGHPRPHHEGHAVGFEFILAKGTTNYRNAGRWYAQVSVLNCY